MLRFILLFSRQYSSYKINLIYVSSISYERSSKITFCNLYYIYYIINLINNLKNISTFLPNSPSFYKKTTASFETIVFLEKSLFDMFCQFFLGFFIGFFFFFQPFFFGFFIFVFCDCLILYFEVFIGFNPFITRQ